MDNYYFIGETIDGDELYGEVDGTVEDCRQYVAKVLRRYGGGHIDIFDKNDKFIDDVEV